jgi:hypothetical protein
MPAGGGGGGGVSPGAAVAAPCAFSGISAPPTVVGGPTIAPTTRRSWPDRAAAAGSAVTVSAALVGTATFLPVHSRNSPHEPQNVSVSWLD